MDDNEYQCQMCGGVFTKTPEWTDDDALAEMISLWDGLTMDDVEVICDECWQIVDPRKEENRTRYQRLQ